MDTTNVIALVKWLQLYPKDEVVKAFRLLDHGYATITDHNEATHSFSVEVESESDPDIIYVVDITASDNSFGGVCDCFAFGKYGSCKHVAAALIEILHHETDWQPQEIEEVAFSRKEVKADAVGQHDLAADSARPAPE